MYFYHTMILLYSITNPQQQQQQQQENNIYEDIPAKPLSPSSNDDYVVMDGNQACTAFTDNSINTDEDTDLQYEVVDTQTRRVNTEDIEIFSNPAYAKTNIN